jgi:surface polysaccharide O-acyltransferase-like enzyme
LGYLYIQTSTDVKKANFPLPVNLIKTVAIILVIIYHVTTEDWNGAALSPGQYVSLLTTVDFFLSFVGIGVPLFFMVSGSLLLQPSKVDEPIKVFLKKRLARIGVAFLFWSAIYFIWSYYVLHRTLTLYSVTQAMLAGGAYNQFWFIYAIMGLYLITPILRMVVKNSNRNILRYLIILWVIAAFVPPLLHLVTNLAMDNTLLVLGGYIGYFVLGLYLMGFNIKTKLLIALLVSGIGLTFLGLLVMQGPFSYLGNYYFFDGYWSFTVLLSSVATFLLLSKVSCNWPGKDKSWLGKLLHAIGENTLPIFFMHAIVIELLNSGTLGVKISLLTIPPLIEIPLVTVLTLFICLATVLVMKKVPVLNKLIG